MPAAPPAADALTLPLPAEAAAALRDRVPVRFADPDTGTVFALDPTPATAESGDEKDAAVAWSDAQPLPTREEVEAQMGQTFGEALREAIAEHEANPDAAIPWEEAQREVRAELARRRAARAEGSA